jgi:lipopolysaccharide/colanic/teichoic acid biosynthesis glycosyltransferase/uncharacterized protein YbjT (DUF2867 family)
MIVLTGATGYVGAQLVADLARDHRLLLVSRDVEAARRRFPGFETCDYGELARHDLNGASVVHLAVRNNDRPGDIGEFRAVNVDLLIEVAGIAKRGGAMRFVNLCTTHALDPADDDAYGRSKRDGARALRDFWPEGGVNLYIPAVYGMRFQGRLARLNRLPGAARPLALALLRQMKPMIAVETLGRAVRAAIAAPMGKDRRWAGELYAADPVPTGGLYAFVKRAIDLMAALTVLVLFGWAMLIVAAYVRMNSPGPAIFAQKRVGRGGRVFTCYKFRTMTLGTADAATHDVSVSAVTSAGQFLRRTKLDELPQMVNVLRNEMSLVGPRPCLPLQTELIDARRARGVLTIKPGITGLAQINDIDMSDPDRLAAWDDRYRAFRTTLGDILILMRTALGGGKGDRTGPAAR